ncbi:MAG: hypothetical protein HYW04_10260 [Deltaproteobacteria bacterium]|nr:hypothetical protein [Deltaproteobacteria bacterium]
MAPANDVADKIGDESKPDVYRVGELEILVYRDREEMVKNLPDVPRMVDGLTFGNQRIKLYGYHDREKKRIYSVDDIPTLIHEFKHYLEPNWEHPAPQFTDTKAGAPTANPAPLRAVERPAKRDTVPLPRLGCLPACLR